MNIILLVLGFILLLKGADWFVDGASSIASRFGIPQLIIGLTIVAMGTSLPEAFVSITAALKSNAAITIGNVVGSNILNVGIILGITALIRPLHIQNSTMKYEMPFMILVTFVLILLGINTTISRLDGIIMWLFFLGYLYYIYKMSKNQMEETEIKQTNPLFIPLGLVCLMIGSNFAVDAATNIAISFRCQSKIYRPNNRCLRNFITRTCHFCNSSQKRQCRYRDWKHHWIEYSFNILFCRRYQVHLLLPYLLNLTLLLILLSQY